MRQKSPSDKELVEQVLRGRTDAFDQLVTRHIHGAHAIAYARVGNLPDTEDAVQEAFLRALEKLRTLRDPAKFGSWLLTIARHEAIRLRAQKVKAEAVAPDALESMAPAPATPEANAHVRERVMQLPEQHRDVLLLHYFAGHSAREIADLLEVRQSAVLKRLQRAREALADTLLRDLEADRPSSEAMAKQAARITALISSAALPAAVGGGATAAAAAAGAGISFKVIAASLALVATGSAIGFSMWRSMESSDSIQTTNTITASATQDELPIPPDSVQPDSTPDPASNADATSASNNDSIAENTDGVGTIAANSDSSAPTSLSGVWSVEVTGPEGAIDQTTRRAIRQLALDDRGGTIDVYAGSSRDHIGGRGRLEGDRVVFELESEESDRRQIAFDIQVTSEYDPAALEMNLAGVSKYARYTPPTDTESSKYEKPVVAPVEMVWRRVGEDKITREQYTEARIRELRRLSRAIFNHAYKNQGRAPSALTQLVPAYFRDLRPYSTEAGVTLTYSPFTMSPPLQPADTDYNTDIENGGARQARMIEVEAICARYYKERLLSTEPIVEAVYDRFDLTLLITKNGVVGTPEEIGLGRAESPAPLTEAQRDELVASCQNNMKQLALSQKMFNNEDREERYSAGWFMLYPEYMPDPKILICPGSGNREVAYEVLFPAVTDKELFAVYESLFGEAGADSRSAQSEMMTRIPMLIELHECSGSGGWNVLFLDGHAEHRKGPLESHPDLAPFLNLR